MGLLNEIFLAVDDDEARRAAGDGPTAAGWTDVIQASGLTNLEIELIEEAITGKQWAPSAGDVITQHADDPDAPWVVPFPAGVTDALLELPSTELVAAAGRWAAFDELRDVELGALASLLDDLVQLTATGASTGKKPYLWVCL